MLEIFYHGSPNSLKVVLFCEEAAVPYRIVPIDILRGEQLTAEYRAINPNCKVPAIRDEGGVVFDSTAILLYLSSKVRCFAPRGAMASGEALSWLMFVATGLGPYSGQAMHFVKYAPEDIPYAINRYRKEVERHYRVLDGHLAERSYLLGAEYSIADMSAWAWARMFEQIVPNGFGAYRNVARWFESINARPAVSRVMQLKSCIVAKKEFDEDALRILFPQNR